MEILTKLIDEIFVNEQLKVLTILKKNDLDRMVLQVLIAVEKVDNMKFLNNKSYISSLSSSYLTNVNSKIENVKSVKEKKELEYIVGELSKQILIRLVEKSSLSPKEVITQITEGLKVSCEFNGWKYSQLNKIMSFDLMHSIAAKGQNKDLTKNNNNTTYYYDWNGEGEDLKELAYDLKDKKIIKSANEFIKLFSEHNGKIYVRIKATAIDFVIILFDELYSKGLITPKGEKAKHFTPIKEHGVDFEKKLLFKNEVKSIKYAIVKNKRKYASIKGRVEKCINEYNVKS